MGPAATVQNQQEDVTGDELEKLKDVTDRMPDFISAEARCTINRVLDALPRLIAEVERHRKQVNRYEPT